jgi:TonB family protein
MVLALALLLLGTDLLAIQTPQDSSSQAPAPQASSASDTRIPDKKVQRPGKIYHVGGDVRPPRIVSAPQPVLDEIKKESAGKKVIEAGATILLVVIGEDGSVRSVKVYKSLNPDLDAKAIEAVRQWKYEPATKKGIPVAVEIAVEVGFHLYK